MITKFIIPLVLALFSSLISRAQTTSPMVLTFMGNYAETTGNTASLSWTAGELFVQTVETENHILTQGFQQNTLTVNPVSQATPPLEVKVFPNPTNDRLIAEFPEPTSARLQLFNLQGIRLLDKRTAAGKVELNLSHLPAAPYILRILDDKLKEKSFKIHIIH